jgi:hypothetical protein
MNEPIAVRKFKFMEAGGFGNELNLIGKHIINEKIKEVSETYIKNMDLVWAQWQVPIWFFGILDIVDGDLRRAKMAPVGLILHTKRDSDTTDEQDKEALENLTDKLNYLLGRVDVGVPSFRQILNYFYTKTPDPTVLDRGPEVLIDGFEAILSGMIVGAWTACEVVVEDMWKAYVNLKPQSILSKNVKKGRLRFSPDTPSLELIVPWQEFKDSGFSLSGRFAEMLEGSYKFDTFDRMNISYASAFDEKFDCFDTDKDRGLFNLAKTRNMIVHAAGKADREFVDAMVQTKSPLAVQQFLSLREKDRVQLDGEIVNELIYKSIKSLIYLTKTVDSLL